MKKNYFKILKSPLLYLALIAIGFFFLYSFPRLNRPVINSSPDENANYFFSKLFAEEGRLTKYEPLNFGIDPIVHPRSINVNAYDNLVPGSFLGLILIYGVIGRILGSSVIIFLTPFFACLAVLFFYGIIKKIFSWPVAFISSVLMFSHPALWYYSTRSMFHNVLFLSFLIMGVYFLINAFEDNSSIKWQKKINIIFNLLAGSFLGLALVIRTAESPWVLLMLFLLLIFYFKKVKLFNLLIIILMIILTGLPILYYNQILYNNSFFSGYANLAKSRESENFLTRLSFYPEASAVSKNTALKMEITGSQLSEDAPKLTFFQKIKKLISNNIPSGLKVHFNLETAYSNFSAYFFNIFNWLSFLFILGFLLFLLNILANISTHLKINEVLKKWIRKILGHTALKEEIIFLLVFIFTSFYLFIYYGSWVFYDTPNTKLITIGTSYTRYWLPIYIMSLVFVGFLIYKISQVLFFKFPKFVFIFVVCLFLTLYSAFFVFSAPHEGIGITLRNSADYVYKKQKIINLTEKDAIIINQYYDKLFFPERRVIASKMYDDPSVIINLPILVKRAPIYYYSFGLKQEDIDYINKRYLKDYGVALGSGRIISGDECIWKIIAIGRDEALPRLYNGQK